MSRRSGIGRAGLARFAAALALAVALAPASAHAQSKTGTTFGQFLMIEPSARLSGMGNAGVGLGRGITGVYYNPASAAGLERWAVDFSHADWLAGIRYDYVAAGLPMGKWGNLYGSVTSLGSGEIDVRTVSVPLGTGERYTVNDVALGLGYGIAITDRFSVGGQLTYVQETIWHSTAQTATLSVGTLYRVAENGLHLGASLANFGTDARYDGRDLRILYDQNGQISGDNSSLPGTAFTENYAVPVLFRVGLGMPFRPTRDLQMALAVDAYHPSDNTESLSAGGEIEYRHLLSLRAGWQNAFLEDTETGLTLGVGLSAELDQVLDYRIDYGWTDFGRLGSTHRVTVGIGFGER